MIELSIRDELNDTLNTVSSDFWDMWSIDNKNKVVGCVFDINNKVQAFQFIKELKVLGAYGKKTEVVLNGNKFIILFFKDGALLLSEINKSRDVDVWAFESCLMQKV